MRPRVWTVLIFILVNHNQETHPDKDSREVARWSRRRRTSAFIPESPHCLFIGIELFFMHKRSEPSPSHDNTDGTMETEERSKSWTGTCGTSQWLQLSCAKGYEPKQDKERRSWSRFLGHACSGGAVQASGKATLSKAPQGASASICLGPFPPNPLHREVAMFRPMACKGAFLNVPETPVGTPAATTLSFLGEEERPAEVQGCEPDPPRQLSKLLTTGGDQTLLLLNTLLGMLFMGPTTSLWYR